MNRHLPPNDDHNHNNDSHLPHVDPDLFDFPHNDDYGHLDCLLPVEQDPLPPKLPAHL